MEPAILLRVSSTGTEAPHSLIAESDETDVLLKTYNKNKSSCFFAQSTIFLLVLGNAK